MKESGTTGLTMDAPGTFFGFLFFLNLLTNYSHPFMVPTACFQPLPLPLIDDQQPHPCTVIYSTYHCSRPTLGLYICVDTKKIFFYPSVFFLVLYK